jgi:N6-L-threonylcarbamoyladenine synthase
MTRILGIETSCDETAAAVVDDRSHVRSSVIASQIELHRQFGGVVPELAARHHVEAIGPVIQRALSEAQTDWDGIDAIAVTRGPGLIGCLLVGVCAAKALAWRLSKPLVAVNHLEGHVRSAFIERPDLPFPLVALVVSGGHTALYLCPEEDVYRCLARTRDDAAGEAFDKVAKLLGLGYPGGPAIDRLARDADERAHRFPRARMKDGSLDFSFSGIKTAARILVRERGLDDAGSRGEPTSEVRDLVASFQRAIVDVLVERTLAVCHIESVRTIVVTGGVACNARLRRVFADVAERDGLLVHFPAPRYTTDNAAMIAAAGFLHLERGRLAGLDTTADANLKLGDVSRTPDLGTP